MKPRFVTYLPLVVFTGVFPVAVGLLLPAAAVLAVPGIVPRPEGEARTILMIDSIAHQALWLVLPAWLLGLPALLVAGLHLGRKLRAPLAGVRFGRSWLSTEVVLAGAFVGCAMASGPLAVFLEVPIFERVMVGAAALAGLGAVAALARIYVLPGQIGWRGVDRAAAPLVAMALTAALVWRATARPEWETVSGTLAVALFVLDTALAAARSGRLVRAVRRRDPTLVHARAALAATRMVPLRFVGAVLLLVALGSFSPVDPLGGGSLMPWTVALLIALSLLDRFAFYAGEARTSPRAAIATRRRDRLERAAGVGSSAP